MAAKQPEHGGGQHQNAEAVGRGTGLTSPVGRGRAEGTGWERAGKGRAGAAPVSGATGVNPEEPPPVPGRVPRLSPVPPRGYFGSWQEVKFALEE